MKTRQGRTLAAHTECYLIAAILGIFLSSSTAFSETLRLVANYWEPLTGDKVLNKGLATDIVTTALRRSGFEPIVIIEPWARALRNVYSGRYDGIVAIWKTEERSQKIQMSDPYFLNRLVFLRRRGFTFRYNSLADLEGLVVGIGRGYDYTQEFMTSNNFTKIEATHSEPLLKMLAANRVDLVLMDEIRAKYHLLTNSNLAGIGLRVDVAKNAMSETPLYFGMSKKCPRRRTVLRSFNRELSRMKRDGTMNDIVNRHGILTL